MEFLQNFHPQIVHTPIVLILVSLLFDLIGRALDREWWRKAALVMLVLGVLGAGAAVLSGLPAGEFAEHHGVPEEAVDAHEDMALLTLWLGIATLIARAGSAALKPVRTPLAVLALLLHLATATTLVVAAHRGGLLVYHHGAAVQVNGQRVSEQGKGSNAAEENEERERK